MALNKNAKKWVRALRSGKFRQTKEKLRGSYGYCCLGVACELAAREGVISPVERISGIYQYAGKDGLLPHAVKEWLGLKSDSGRFEGPDGTSSLADMNDCGKRFLTIAKIIESEPEGLFAE